MNVYMLQKPVRTQDSKVNPDHVNKFLLKPTTVLHKASPKETHQISLLTWYFIFLMTGWLYFYIDRFVIS